MYWCSCSRRRAEFVDCLSSIADTTNEEVNKAYPECLHIVTVKEIVEEVDGMYGISAEVDFTGN